MLRLLGKEKGNSGSIQGGLEVLRSFLVNAGIKPDQFVFLDGSGLSREDLVTPEAMVLLLQYCHKAGVGAGFRGHVAGGSDGWFPCRPLFRNTPATGMVRAKTGSLSHVYALSGYATTQSGNHIAFAIMTNNNNMATKEVLDTIDEIVLRLLEDK